MTLEGQQKARQTQYTTAAALFVRTKGETQKLGLTVYNAASIFVKHATRYTTRYSLIMLFLEGTKLTNGEVERKVLLKFVVFTATRTQICFVVTMTKFAAMSAYL